MSETVECEVCHAKFNSFDEWENHSDHECTHNLLARITELEAMIDTADFRKWLVEKLKDDPELQKAYAKSSADNAAYLDVIENLRTKIAELEAERRWIPVSESLPNAAIRDGVVNSVFAKWKPEFRPTCGSEYDVCNVIYFRRHDEQFECWTYAPSDKQIGSGE